MFIPLNLTVALKDVVIWNEEDEINVYGSSNITLLNFLEYRYDVLIETHPNDFAHLLTSRDFDYGVVGRSYSNFICSSFYSGGISTILNGTLPYIASVIAHEIGHNLGLTHDSKNCSCGPKLCLMSNSMGENEIDYLWSNCSIEQFRKLEIPNCLRCDGKSALKILKFSWSEFSEIFQWNDFKSPFAGTTLGRLERTVIVDCRGYAKHLAATQKPVNFIGKVSNETWIQQNTEKLVFQESFVVYQKAGVTLPSIARATLYHAHQTDE